MTDNSGNGAERQSALQLRSAPAGTKLNALVPAQLYRQADLSGLVFKTTADLAPIEGLLGQERALDAIQFSAKLEKAGFNLFAIGQAEARMRQTVITVLRDAAKTRPVPLDWTYVNNFADPRKPIAISLPPGRGPVFHDAMHELIDDLKVALPSTFQSEEYQTQRGAIDETFRKKQAEAFTALQDKSAEKNITILRTPMGFTLAPSRNGEVVPPNEFSSWPPEQREAVRRTIEELEKELEHIVRQMPAWERQHRDTLRQLNRETAQAAVGHLIEEKKAEFSDIPGVVAHLERVQNDLIDNVAMFIAGPEESQIAPSEAMTPGGPFDRYEVNVFVTQASHDGEAPIVDELHPTLSNLTGCVEHIARQGALLTNFRLIKAGAIHKANGGYLLLDMRNLLMEPFSWAALKRALRRREIVIEDASQFMGLTSTVSLEPDPIPLDLKVVIFGDRMLYYLLASVDPELAEHFKVLADFDDDIARTPETEGALAHFIATLLRNEALRPMTREGVALTLEFAARRADHAGKLTMLVDDIRDLLIEADHWASEAGSAQIQEGHVETAIAQRIRRAARLRDRAQEMILDHTALIDTEGARIGQINGLSVLSLGGFSFGRPTRITCQIRPGAGRVIDIERETKLGGPLHSKGVLILSGFLAGRYALDTPMSLQASLVFEQSYSGVDGDSASSAELYALMSALSELPLRQDLAVTGSVNQHGEIQAIGGVNEKIEGFFDICDKRGLTGQQGVLIPAANVQHLMLRADVVEACQAGRFAVYPVATIEEGIALLTGCEAGVRGAEGAYPHGSVNRLIEDRLRAFAQIRRSFAVEAAKSQSPPAS